MSNRILDVHDLERAGVLLAVLDHSDTPNVVPAADHRRIPSLKFDPINHLVGGKVKADCVVNLDIWVRVTQGSAVVRGGVRNSLRTPPKGPDAAQLIGSFLL